MKFCNDCGEAWGYCICRSCECGETAMGKCFHCGGDFCAEHLRKQDGLHYCAPCLEDLATYKPCANPDPARKCADKKFAPELLHECNTCGQDFCAACTVETPVPGTIRLAQHHCPRCSQQQQRQIAAA